MLQKGMMYLTAGVAALAGLLFGFDTGVISGAILFINDAFHLNHIQTEIIVSTVLVGAFLGAIISGRLCDTIGRKRIILVTALIFIIGTLFCTFAQSVEQLIFGRIILGFAIGIASFATPIYLAEIALPKKRGLIVSLNQLAITIGILLSYLIDYYFSDDGAWRMMFLAGIIPALLLFIGMLFLPESPRFLIAKGKILKAKEILKKLHGKESEFDFLAYLSPPQKNTKLKNLLRHKRLVTVLLIGITLAVAQQITGINTIIYYAPTVFKLAGFNSNNAIFVTSLIGLVNVLATLIALPLVDKIGRKPMLYVGLTGMCLSLILLGLSLNQANPSSLMRIMALLSMMVYITSFAISLGPMVFIILSEIFPLSIRGFGMSLAMCANWAANMIIAMSFLSFVHHLGMSNTFYLFAFFCVFTLYFVHGFIPETKGISLEQIEKHIFEGIKSKHLGQKEETHAASK